MCSGQRDPAAYLRRAQLATPNAIDQDYNYLSGLERHVESVERRLDERGIVEADARTGSKQRFRKGELNVLQAIERCGVVVEKAPRGMQRQKSNNTHWNKKRKCLTWTVEWIDASQKSRLSQVAETTSLAEAYDTLMASEISERPPPSNKRKRESPEATATTTSKPSSPPPSPPSSQPQLYFYLHRVQTPSRTRVLIHLDQPTEVTLSTVLRDKVVLEYPTIYILPNPPDALPEGFQAEEEFLKVKPVSRGDLGEGTRLNALDVETEERNVEEEAALAAAAAAVAADGAKLRDVLLGDLTRNADQSGHLGEV
ncbi:MAG: hypothetical protein M4579_005173 [Chaenotheca gracillima]|nr:MAG: hypothetical protein M4579_005173 [Chaenotheca gracillima]